jgi:hypothetical protein
MRTLHYFTVDGDRVHGPVLALIGGFAGVGICVALRPAPRGWLLTLGCETDVAVEGVRQIVGDGSAFRLRPASPVEMEFLPSNIPLTTGCHNA